MDGVEGVWYPTEYARCVLRDVTLLEGRTLELNKTKEKLAARVSQVEDLTRASLLWRDQEKAMNVIINSQERRISDLESDWRSPWLWLAIGVVAGGAAVVAVGSSL